MGAILRFLDFCLNKLFNDLGLCNKGYFGNSNLPIYYGER